jgi:predicted NAD/FAD-dependent oxidoreductase
MSAPEVLRVAVVGAGVAGAACAAALQRGGVQVRVFEKSRGLGGRMATRRARYTDLHGQPQTTEFDHGAQQITAHEPLFGAAMARAAAAGHAVPWQPRIAGLADGFGATPIQAGHTSSHAPLRYLPVPNMPALCQHWLAGVPVQLQATVTRLQRGGDGRWRLQLAEASAAAPEEAAQPLFDRVVLAMPPAQAAALLADHQPAWSQALRGVEMTPCWTLMAVSDRPDAGSSAEDWDARVPADGPLAWVSRNDRRPGRAAPAGQCTWVAQASAAWSLQHLEDEAPQVERVLLQALLKTLAGAAGVELKLHHTAVHRWRYALAAQPVQAPDSTPWWDAASGLGVCGDFTRGADIEAAWLSGHQLAHTLLASAR